MATSACQTMPLRYFCEMTVPQLNRLANSAITTTQHEARFSWIDRSETFEINEKWLSFAENLSNISCERSERSIRKGRPFWRVRSILILVDTVKKLILIDIDLSQSILRID